MQNGNAMQKNTKNASGVNDTTHHMHDRRTIETALAASKREYLSKTYMFLKCPTPPLKKIYNFKWAT
jgi:hypothetical protein